MKLVDFWRFLHLFLFYFYIPILAVWVFIITVRILKSNIAGFLVAGALITGLIAAASFTSYEQVFNIAVYSLVPAFMLLVVSGWHNDAYKKRLESTDPVYEKIKEKFSQKAKEQDITLHEKKEAK